MTEIWLVRHGQTDWNLEHRYQGQRDLPLNVTGIAQAQELANELDGQHFQSLYASDLSRARQTAEVLARKFHLPIQLDSRLRECNFGSWEGLVYQEVELHFPEEYEARRRDPLNSPPRGGESLAQVALRVAHAASDIARQHPSGKVLLVSHGLALATLVCLARDFPVSQARTYILENARPEVIQWEPGQQALVELR
jgi:2,3-bisphosphoglycerate-dependent phosphoglycerate mutase